MLAINHPNYPLVCPVVIVRVNSETGCDRSRFHISYGGQISICEIYEELFSKNPGMGSVIYLLFRLDIPWSSQGIYPYKWLAS